MCFEISNNHIHDLLNSKSTDLELYEEIKEGKIIRDLSEYVCSSYNKAIEIISLLKKNKHYNSSGHNMCNSMYYI